MVKYNYDAYGNVISNSNKSFYNPFRYKGYYYEEIGLFWCNSRYYNPEWGRWLTPDSIEYLDPTNVNGLNLFAYCGNDPANMYDPSGHIAITNSAIFAGTFVSGIINAATVMARFIETLGISSYGVGFSAYFTYYLWPSFNKLRR